MLFYESPRNWGYYAHMQAVYTRPLLGREGPGDVADYIHTSIYTNIHTNLHHDPWVDHGASLDKRYCHSNYTLAQPFIFPYTLWCMVARTTNTSAVAN